MLGRRRNSLLGLVWLVVGAIVATSHHFMARLQTVSQIGSAILAVILWPLVALHIHIAI
ncbi:MAG TPA: hypothetical protein VHT30_02275 [Acidimicrobiales bacterium]|jgi:ABC-type anion transport system duplicated permease subunit|nr:hypothetical protein [Acidimicrobiales bacterium]